VRSVRYAYPYVNSSGGVAWRFVGAGWRLTGCGLTVVTNKNEATELLEVSREQEESTTCRSTCFVCLFDPLSSLCPILFTHCLNTGDEHSDARAHFQRDGSRSAPRCRQPAGRACITYHNDISVHLNAQAGTYTR
jgi:hypothetical protein